MFTHQAKDGHLAEGSVLKTENLALRLNSQNYQQVTTAMDGHPPSLGGSPAVPRMVTHQSKEGHPVYHHLTLLGLSCICLALFSPVWPRLTHLAPFWPSLALFGPVWPCLAPFGPVWPRLAPFDPIWHCLALFGFIWPHLAHFH